jgi:hypothetical protein
MEQELSGPSTKMQTQDADTATHGGKIEVERGRGRQTRTTARNGILKSQWALIFWTSTCRCFVRSPLCEVGEPPHSLLIAAFVRCAFKHEKQKAAIGYDVGLIRLKVS